MGIGSFFRKIFRSEPVTIDYSGMTEGELRRLWLERADLTDEARVVLRAELERRGIAPQAEDEDELPESASDADEVPLPDVAEDEDLGLDSDDPIREGLFAAQARCGVLLRASAHGYVLVLQPLWDGRAPLELAAPRLPEGARIEAIVALDDAPGGWLPTSRTASALRLPAERVFVTGDGPADRLPPGSAGGPAVTATPLPKAKQFGQLVVRRRKGLAGVLEVEWDGRDWLVVVGPRVPLGALVQEPLPTHAIGGLTVPAPEEAAEAARTGGLPELAAVILTLDAAGAASEPFASLFPSAGVAVHSVGRESAGGPAAQPLLDAAQRDDAEAMERMLGKATAVDTEVAAAIAAAVAEALAVERPGAARALLDTARRHVGTAPLLAFPEALALAADGDADGAAAVLLAGTSADAPEPRAWGMRAELHAARGEHAEALACARAQYAALPDDEHANAELVRALAYAGRKEEAEAALRSAGEKLPPERRIQLAALLAAANGPAPVPRPGFATLAESAYAHALRHARNGAADEAERLLRRALALHPLHVEALAQLGTTLSELGRHDEALTLLGEALAASPEMDSLHFHRGNTFVRLGRLLDAVPEYEACARIAPTWEGPLVNLVSALHALGRKAEARVVYNRLEDQGTPEEILEQLRQRLRS